MKKYDAGVQTKVAVTTKRTRVVAFLGTAALLGLIVIMGVALGLAEAQQTPPTRPAPVFSPLPFDPVFDALVAQKESILERIQSLSPARVLDVNVKVLPEDGPPAYAVSVTTDGGFVTRVELRFVSLDNLSMQLDRVVEMCGFDLQEQFSIGRFLILGGAAGNSGEQTLHGGTGVGVTGPFHTISVWSVLEGIPALKSSNGRFLRTVLRIENDAGSDSPRLEANRSQLIGRVESSVFTHTRIRPGSTGWVQLGTLKISVDDQRGASGLEAAAAVPYANRGYRLDVALARAELAGLLPLDEEGDFHAYYHFALESGLRLLNTWSNAAITSGVPDPLVFGAGFDLGIMIGPRLLISTGARTEFAGRTGYLISGLGTSWRLSRSTISARVEKLGTAPGGGTQAELDPMQAGPRGWRVRVGYTITP